MPQQQDPSAPMTLSLKQFGGLNLLLSTTAIGDNEFSALKGLMPLKYSLKGIGANESVYAAAKTVFWGALSQRANTAYAVLFYTDGSAEEVDLGTGTATQIGPAATFSTGAATVGGKSVYPDATGWKNAMTLVLDPNTGYFSWDGTTRTVIDATQKGHAIGVHKQRAWLINNRDITFSAAGDYSDMNVADAAGSSNEPDSTLLGPLICVQPLGAYLFFGGTNFVGALSYVDVQNGIPVYNLQSFAPGVGPHYPGGMAVGSGTAFLSAVSQGVPLTGPSPPDITEPLGTAWGPGTVAAGTINGQLCLMFHVQSSNRIFAVYGGYWFELAAPSNLIRIFSAVSGDKHLAYAVTTAGVYSLASSSGWQPVSISGKLFDWGAALYGKTATRMGLFGEGDGGSFSLSAVNEPGDLETYSFSPGSGKWFVAHDYSTLGKYVGWQVSMSAPNAQVSINEFVAQAHQGEDW